MENDRIAKLNNKPWYRLLKVLTWVWLGLVFLYSFMKFAPQEGWVIHSLINVSIWIFLLLLLRKATVYVVFGKNQRSETSISTKKSTEVTTSPTDLLPGKGGEESTSFSWPSYVLAVAIILIVLFPSVFGTDIVSFSEIGIVVVAAFALFMGIPFGYYIQRFNEDIDDDEKNNQSLGGMRETEEPRK